MHADDQTRLRHIVDAARQAIAFVEGRRPSELETDRMLSLALVRLLEIIGEAARGVSSGYRDTHADIPWRKMAGMRDRLIHGYFDVDLKVVWSTVTDDLPPLLEAMEPLIDDGTEA